MRRSNRTLRSPKQAEIDILVAIDLESGPLESDGTVDADEARNIFSIRTMVSSLTQLFLKDVCLDGSAYDI